MVIKAGEQQPYMLTPVLQLSPPVQSIFKT